jgi:hypothetical protein
MFCENMQTWMLLLEVSVHSTEDSKKGEDTKRLGGTADGVPHANC